MKNLSSIDSMTCLNSKSRRKHLFKTRNCIYTNKDLPNHKEWFRSYMSVLKPQISYNVNDALRKYQNVNSKTIKLKPLKDLKGIYKQNCIKSIYSSSYHFLYKFQF